MGHRERVLEFLTTFPGRDDDEIASALNIVPRQTVNMICRKLCQEGLVRRECGPRGKLINFIATHAARIAPARTERSRAFPAGGLTEDQVKETLATMLESEGWSVQVAWGRSRGIDITATRDQERWVIECKLPA